MLVPLIIANQARAPACSAIPVAISGRPPMRSTYAPAIGAISIGMAVQGSVATPARSGEYPCTSCRYWVSRKIEPNMPKYISSDAAFDAAKARLRKKRIGSIGADVRSSQATKLATSTAPAPSATRIWGSVQPSVLPRTSPQTIPNSPLLTSASPGMSRERSGPWLSRSRVAASGSTASPMGTFSQKIHCHEMPSTTAPPTSGPMATPSPLIADQNPSARPRRSTGTASDSSVSVSGSTIAPPNPCAARAAISQLTSGARAAAADDAVNTARPITNMRRRPNRSPSAAPVSSSTAKVRV